MSYKKWIIKYYPDAAKFGWEKMMGGLITDPVITIGHKTIPLKSIPYKILNKLGFRRTGVDSKRGMNPYGYYIKTNDNLSRILNSYYRYSNVIEDAWVRDHINKIQKNGTSVEILQAVSLLSAIKLYFK